MARGTFPSNQNVFELGGITIGFDPSPLDFIIFFTTYFIFTAHLPSYLKLIGWIFEKIIYFIF